MKVLSEAKTIRDENLSLKSEMKKLGYFRANSWADQNNRKKVDVVNQSFWLMKFFLPIEMFLKIVFHSKKEEKLGNKIFSSCLF